MGSSIRAVTLVFYLAFLTVTTFGNCFCNANSNVICIESERQALLQFKQDLKDPSNKLISWAGEDCCQWFGVVCDDSTGHVLEINLGNFVPESNEIYSSSQLVGKINPSLFNLTHLTLLDLRHNDFEGRPIPSFIGSIKSLTLLELSNAGFGGVIPHELGNLSMLQSLCLEDYFHSNLRVEDLEWLSGMSSLQHLDMSGINLSIAGDHWLQVINTLPSLEELYLSNCKLNHIRGHKLEINPSLLNLTHLTLLDLRHNDFEGRPIPSFIGSIKSLTLLELSYAGFGGVIPHELGNLSMLYYLSLEQYVQSNLSVENLTWLSGLSSLQHLDMSGINLSIANDHWLQVINKLPSLANLYLSNCQLSHIPTWFWSNPSQSLRVLCLSNNHFHGEIPSLLNFAALAIILGSNHFKGPLPLISSSISFLDLSNNSFLGSMHNFLCDGMEIPNSLEILVLAHNLLSGGIPDCWVMKWYHLKVIRLDNNSLTGNIPTSMGYLPSLGSLYLRNNNLSGELPVSLQNCTELVTVDLSGNEFHGTIPAWMGKCFSKLVVLNLRSNKFQNNIPHELCHLSSLQILDIAHNNISGLIPRCFSNFSVMAGKQNSSAKLQIPPFAITTVILDNAFLVTKGREFEYNSVIILPLLLAVDLSTNNLSGEIPEELTTLVGLQTLNLSENHFTGRIPQNVGNMTSLESLDLSLNQLSGEIPPSMSSLTSLSHLNLSYNNLSGKIPSSTQFQSFDASGFVGNKLCGPPLKENCGEHGVTPNAGNEGKKGGDQFRVDLFASIALGFIVGFWAIIGPLLIKMSWRIAYFRFLDSMEYKLRDVVYKCCRSFNH